MLSIEYSETQGVFHNNTGYQEANTHGYVTIAKGISVDIADQFYSYMDGLYGGNLLMPDGSHVKIDIVKEEWDKFILTKE